MATYPRALAPYHSPSSCQRVANERNHDGTGTQLAGLEPCTSRTAGRLFSRCCRTVLCGALLSIALGLALPATAEAANTCGPNSFKKKAAKPIPRDPDGLKGRLIRTQKDDAGNVIQVWCIETVAGVGNSFGYRYVPKGGNPVWYARCAFVGGNNTPGKEPAGDMDGNGRPDTWTKLKHTTEDDSGTGGANDDDGQPGKKDYDWEYDIAANNLRRWETNNGVRVRPNMPDFDGLAPESFGGLFAAQPPPNPNQQDAMLHDPLLSVVLATHVGDLWAYLLSGNSLVEFSPTVAFPGDSFAIAASDITGAFAPTDWLVDFDSAYVKWTYDGMAPLNLSLGPVSGFNLVSVAPEGRVRWLADSIDDDLVNFGYAGGTTGPSSAVPEPATLALLALAACAIKRRRCDGGRQC